MNARLVPFPPSCDMMRDARRMAERPGRCSNPFAHVSYG